MQKRKPLKTFTFEYRDGAITFNREDGYTAFYPAGNRLGGADTKFEAEAMIDAERRAEAVLVAMAERDPVARRALAQLDARMGR